MFIGRGRTSDLLQRTSMAFSENNAASSEELSVLPLLQERRPGDSNGGDEHTEGLFRGRKLTPGTAPLDIESYPSASSERRVARPGRLLARPVPFEPITDPFACVCDIARRPKFGHQYVLCPRRSRQARRVGRTAVGLSVGPHWSGVIYTASIIAFITLFLTRFIMQDLAPWYQPVTVGCSLLTVVFLVATAVADPGIVVESAERCADTAFCEVCSIWMPDATEHCEEW